MTGDFLIVVALLVLAFQSMVQLSVFTRARRPNSSQPSPSEKPVTIIVCVKNEEDHVRRLMDGILRQAHKNLQLLIVDDHSTDHTLTILQEVQRMDNRLTIISLDSTEPTGKKYALDRAIREAAHERIVLTDADCQLDDENWLDRFHQAFEQDEADLIIGSGHYKPIGPWSARLHALDAFRSNMLFHTAAQLEAPYMAVGRSMGLRKSAYLKIDGFGHDLQSPGTDDMLLHRFVGSYNVCSVPEAVTWSKSPQSIKEAVLQKRRHLSVGHRYPSWSLIWIWANEISLLMLPMVFVYGLSRFDSWGYTLTAFVVFRMLLFRQNLLMFRVPRSIQERHVYLWWTEFIMSYWNALISILTLLVHNDEWTRRKRVQGQKGTMN